MSRLVSIIVPTYNRSSIIGTTLKSIQSQTFYCWECIVVDDGSIDNTEELVLSFAAKDNRILYTKNKCKKGAPGARNSGLAMSQGEFVLFLDSDDLLLSNCLEKRVKLFKHNISLDIIVAQQKRLINGVDDFYINIPSKEHPLLRFFSLAPVHDIPWINNTLIKKSFLLNNHICWDETLEKYQDIQFNLSMLLYKPQVMWSNDDFDSYWVSNSHVKNIGSDNTNQFQKVLKILRVYSEVFKKLNETDALVTSVKQQYHSLLLSFCFDFALDKAINYKELLDFIRENSEFGWLHRSLISFNRKVNSVDKRYYIHRLAARKIREYLTARYPPVIKNGTFLKVKSLSMKTNTVLEYA